MLLPLPDLCSHMSRVKGEQFLERGEVSAKDQGQGDMCGELGRMTSRDVVASNQELLRSARFVAFRTHTSS